MDLSKVEVPEGTIQAPMVTCVIEGILEEDDLRELALGAVGDTIPPVPEEDPSDLKKVREKHHSVARMLASGLTQRMVASLCGYTESYLSILLNNPSMQELVELYRIQAGHGAQVITERLRTVGLKAIEKLEERLDADQLDNQELLGTAKLGLDRGGFGPTSKSHIVSEQHHIDHAELQRLNKDARTRNAEYIVPAAEVRAALTDQRSKEPEYAESAQKEEAVSSTEAPQPSDSGTEETPTEAS